MREPKKNLFQIQAEYIATVNAGIARWSHRPRSRWEVAGGHAGRIIAGAHRKAERQLRAWGFTDAQIKIAIQEAADMAKLERIAEEE